MDKIEKVKQKIEELKSKLIHGACSSQIAMETRCKEEAYNEVLAILDNMQEEPVSKDYRERYKNIAQSDAFKSAYENKSLGEVMSVEGEEPVSEELEDAANFYANTHTEWFDADNNPHVSPAFKAGAKWQEEQDQETIEVAEDHAMLAGMEKMKEQMMENIWKPADGDDLPEIDREVIALVQDYPDDKDHLRVVFAHRPNKYAKIWNSDLGEEQVVEIERHGKGGWNIPNIVCWLDVELPKEIEL